MIGLRVLVCGGRDFADRDKIARVLGRTHAERGISVLIHGAASGADSLAGAWAKQHGVPTEAYPADWKANGRAAGPIRNRRMLAEGKPDGVIAFPGGRGTADMILAAKDAGLKVWEVSP